MNEKNRNGTNGHRGELELVKLYMELTGASESGARSVFMFHDSLASEAPEGTRDAALTNGKEG